MSDSYDLKPIAIAHSCFREKFGTPRQSGLVPAASAELELLAPYNRAEALTGLEGFSHVWLIFVFHHCIREAWRPMVKPPRLGGKEKVGVFATRSNYRPNPLGLSAVKLEGIDEREEGIFIRVSGADLVNGTPIIDIKPYLPFADSLPDANSGFAEAPPQHVPVFWSAACRHLHGQQPDLAALIEQTLRQDPRPAYYKGRVEGRVYGTALAGHQVRWCFDDEQGHIEVLEVVEED